MLYHKLTISYPSPQGYVRIDPVQAAGQILAGEDELAALMTPRLCWRARLGPRGADPARCRARRARRGRRPLGRQAPRVRRLAYVANSGVSSSSYLGTRRCPVHRLLVTPRYDRSRGGGLRHHGPSQTWFRAVSLLMRASHGAPA